MKNTFITILVIIVVILGGYLIINKTPNNNDLESQTDIKDTINNNDTQTPTATTTTENKTQTIIGQSVENQNIMAYHFGEGKTEILFVGGIHGSYDWNTALLAYQIIDYLKANPEIIPANEKITIIPVLNPDGLKKGIGTSDKFTADDIPTNNNSDIVAGRFNSHGVDLNRNFDCDWQPSGKWQNKTVSGGEKAFSEPESQAIKNYIETNEPKAVIVWYSAAGGVFPSNCHSGVLEETRAITNIYAKASGYKGYEKFDFYTITGDMVNWLAKVNIPAISVLLTNHTDTEFSKNKSGVEAVLKYYSK